MGSSDPFESPFLLLDRARENREELNERSRRFFHENPSTRFVERDPETGLFLRKAKLSAPFPRNLWPVAADAFNNLRSALDQGISASVSLLRPGASLNGVGFVFGTSQTHFEKAIADAPKVVDPRVYNVMRFFQPYDGGNNRLWVLNHIARANKHRSLVGLGASVDSVEVNLLELSGSGPILKPYWDDAKNELIISRAVQDHEPLYDLHVSFFIAFGEIEGIKGMPVVPQIDYLAAVVGAFLTGLASDVGRWNLEAPFRPNLGEGRGSS
jgi:hypothetical protein